MDHKQSQAKIREWQRNNPDKVREYRRRYERTHKKQLQEYRRRLRQSRETRKQEFATRAREYRRANIVWANGRRFRVAKRPYPGLCEVCLKAQDKGLRYHAWDVNRMHVGVWVCWVCHNVAKAYEQGRLRKYMELKARLDDQL